MKGRLLSIEEQIDGMRRLWPAFPVSSIRRDAGSARWIGKIQPQFTAFIIEIRYRVGGSPEVRVVEPELVRLAGNSEGELPHVYPPANNPTLCLFDPQADQWDGSMLIAETIVPWALDWIGCYEFWLMTGRWTGGGRHAGQPLGTKA